MPSYYRDQRDQLAWDEKRTTIRCNPRWIQAEPERWHQVHRDLPRWPGHVWLATSGSTSVKPQLRWVALSETALLSAAQAVNAHLNSDQRDIWLHALPLFHVGGLGILARARLSGARIQAGITGQRWDPKHFYRVAQASQATLTALVPSQLHDLVQLDLHAPRALRAVIVGGSALSPELLRHAQRLGWPCLPSYGMTETGAQVATAPLSALGQSDPPLQILEHAQLRSDANGIIWVMSPSLLSAYAEWSPELGVWDPKVDGWLRSDDLGHVEGNRVVIRGRQSDIVKVLGEQVHLESLEKKLAERLNWGQFGVDWALIAPDHPRLGAELILCVAAQNAVTSDSRASDSRASDSRASDSRARDSGLGDSGLGDAVTSDSRTNNSGSGDSGSRDMLKTINLKTINAGLLPYERIQRLLTVTEIPRTPLGKLQRLRLQAEATAQVCI